MKYLQILIFTLLNIPFSMAQSHGTQDMTIPQSFPADSKPDSDYLDFDIFTLTPLNPVSKEEAQPPYIIYSRQGNEINIEAIDYVNFLKKLEIHVYEDHAVIVSLDKLPDYYGVERIKALGGLYVITPTEVFYFLQGIQKRSIPVGPGGDSEF